MAAAQVAAEIPANVFKAHVGGASLAMTALLAALNALDSTRAEAAALCAELGLTLI